MTQYVLFAESSSGIGALGVHLSDLIIQLITFALAYLVLRKFAFGPIIKALDERRKTIAEGVSLGEKMKQDEAALQTSIADELHKARVEADGIIASAQEASKATIREAEDKARSKAAGIVHEAEERIVTDMARARKKLEAELVGLVSDATEVIIGEKVDAKKDAALIDKALAEQRA